MAKAQSDVDFKRLIAEIKPIPVNKEIQGQGVYTFQMNKKVDSIYLDAYNMLFSEITLNGKAVAHNNSGKQFSIKAPKKIGEYQLGLSFKAKPKQTVYFLGWEDSIDGNEQIWTQGQGKYTSHWLPSLDNMNDKLEFDLSFLMEAPYKVISNGALLRTQPKDGLIEWQFNMENPMSSYLVAFVIGKFEKKTITASSGIPLELYYEPKDSLKVEPTYRFSKKLFDFLEQEIGVAYPWQNYKQIPVQDFLYAGMENTGATVFSNTFMVDSVAFKDKNYVNVNAHEMAHQWFGNLVTEESGEHHWLHEGFATFYAYLAEKQIFGKDYYYWKLFETAKALQNFSGEGNGEALTNSAAGSLTFYEKGAWALVMLKERVGGAAFKEGIQNYLEKFAFQNVTIQDFMWEIEKASGMKLTDFEEQWLQESEFPFDKAKAFLTRNNTSIKRYFEIKKRIEANKTNKESELTTVWEDLGSERLKEQLMLDYSEQLSFKMLKGILNDEKSKVRQAVALATEKVPEELRMDFEQLLDDNSYKTIEATLFRLWSDFPEHQNRYLDKTINIIGFPNKNVHLLWLTLALVSPDYEVQSKKEFFDALNAYTGAEHHFEVRMLAFQFLKNIGGFNNSSLKNLIEACNHHVWYFKKSSRKMLKEFLKNADSQSRIQEIYPSLTLEQQKYLDQTLGK
ncbi:M1 family metallopeptidase [Muricauda sp. 2012CJ35-5]|uniref:Aminopeptidase N n=1 Tax=Flagellimonas spongiicola TaxID=2942208 RepID=A0ABT0PPA8_9FLAO|nr:M1 family metallopeptidase [Allomuricauda spongiicola]MCL6273230.1 M1 family metallopeptidase [Allomuricauda spongiicola]